MIVLGVPLVRGSVPVQTAVRKYDVAAVRGLAAVTGNVRAFGRVEGLSVANGLAQGRGG
jgi:hypothetical protein